MMTLTPGYNDFFQKFLFGLRCDHSCYNTATRCARHHPQVLVYTSLYQGLQNPKVVPLIEVGVHKTSSEKSQKGLYTEDKQKYK